MAETENVIACLLPTFNHVLEIRGSLSKGQLGIKITWKRGKPAPRLGIYSFLQPGYQPRNLWHELLHDWRQQGSQTADSEQNSNQSAHAGGPAACRVGLKGNRQESSCDDRDDSRNRRATITTIGYNRRMWRETCNLEFKQQVSDSFLKTVSAFANGSGGQVLFGITDDGVRVGLADPQADALLIENKINTTLDPIPPYSIDIGEDATVTLTVERGPFTPYLYRRQAYRRADSSTVAVDRLDLGRLILQGSNQTFDGLVYRGDVSSLTFDALGEKVQHVLGVKDFDPDVLKTLELMTPTGEYTNAAALMADHNDFPGIDIAVFGKSINEIRARHNLAGTSLILQLHAAVEIMQQTYHYELIDGTQRRIVASIPTEAFREAVANALVHRQWDVPSHIRIAMFPDRIEITSPGGLPPGITEEEYLRGHLSLPRNVVIAGLFFRLGYIEKFGTGIVRIKHAYRNSVKQPVFEIGNVSITVTLPVVTEANEVSAEELSVLRALEDGESSRSDVQNYTGLSRDATIRALNSLIEVGAIKRMGAGPATRYRRI
ncbi:ATP-binding protein [Corynebacterium renale]|nr:ATP-binding protein [Corynebacterium renale]